MLILRDVIWIFSLYMIVAGAGVASGQDYPNKTIRIITLAAGGGSDFTARQVAQGISGTLGQPVVVDNRTAIQAGEVVSKSAPDGYTLLVGGSGTWIMSLLQKLPYDGVKDFTPITLIDKQVNVLAVHQSVPVKSVKELIALAKARPGELNYGSVTAGGPAHLGGELFKSMAGVNILNVPYKTTPQAVTALITAEVQLTFVFNTVSVMPHVKSGQLRILAVTSAEPTALAPGLPTVAASGLPGFELVGMTGIYAPAKTPMAIINRLNLEILRALNKADVKERFLNAGSEIVGNSPEQFAAIIKSDMAIMGKVIKDAGIRAE